MATHSSILAWRIPRTEEAGGIQSMWWQSQAQLSNLAHSTLVMGLLGTRDSPLGPVFAHHLNEDSLSLELFLVLRVLGLSSPLSP